MNGLPLWLVVVRPQNTLKQSYYIVACQRDDIHKVMETERYNRVVDFVTEVAGHSYYQVPTRFKVSYQYTPIIN